MIDPHLYEILRLSLRVLFLVALPLLIAVTLGGVVAGILQGVTTIRDPSVGYGVRLVALLSALYLFFADIERSLLELFRVALG